MNKGLNWSSSSTTHSIVVGNKTVAVGRAIVSDSATGKTGAKRAKRSGVEKAVYGHLRALRALGRTTVNAVEIADALSIPPGEVLAALRSLASKGVKVAA